MSDSGEQSGGSVKWPDVDSVVDCRCGHRKDAHCNGVEYCKVIGCRCHAFEFRSDEDKRRWWHADATARTGRPS